MFKVYSSGIKVVDYSNYIYVNFILNNVKLILLICFIFIFIGLLVNGLMVRMGEYSFGIIKNGVLFVFFDILF